MNIEIFLPKNQILLLKENTKQLVIKEMLTKLEKLGMIDNVSKFYTQFMHRESLENTGIGNGLAIPHIRTELVDNLYSIFAFSQVDIDYNSFDGLPVRYFLLSVFPSKYSTKYLYLTGIISNMFNNSEIKKQIKDMDTETKIYSLIKRNSKKYLKNITDEKNNMEDEKNNNSNTKSYKLDLIIRLDRFVQLKEKGELPENMTNKIEELKVLLDTKTVKYYDKMRKNKKDPFAILEGKSCSGCHMTLAPVYLAKILESDDIPVCNMCGRFLIVI